MKYLTLIPLIYSLYFPVFGESYKKYKKEDFQKIKLMKIEHLNKKIQCVEDSYSFKELKKCWGKKKK